MLSDDFECFLCPQKRLNFCMKFSIIELKKHHPVFFFHWFALHFCEIHVRYAKNPLFSCDIFWISLLSKVITCLFSLISVNIQGLIKAPLKSKLKLYFFKKSKNLYKLRPKCALEIIVKILLSIKNWDSNLPNKEGNSVPKIMATLIKSMFYLAIIKPDTPVCSLRRIASS